MCGTGPIVSSVCVCSVVALVVVLGGVQAVLPALLVFRVEVFDDFDSLSVVFA